jgi:transcriptional regulator with XRE-family HTH domain
MLDKELTEKIRQYKERHHYTLHDLSKRADIQISTLERWLKTGRINKVYAQVIKERLGL